MSLYLQNMCSWMEKNPKQMLWLQTRVEILNLSQKKCASRVEKKKNLSREWDQNADQLCCQSMSSLNWDETLI